MSLIDDHGLFAMFGVALGLTPPCRATSVAFNKEAGKLEIRLDFPRGSRFACPHEGCENASCPGRATIDT